MAQISIETHGGLEAITNFKLFVEPNINFVVKSKIIKETKIVETTETFKCIEYKGKANRQCYRCDFCHDVDMCQHMQCCIPCSDGNPKLYKYKLVKKLDYGNKETNMQ